MPVLLDVSRGDMVARVTLRADGKLNAISVSMWHELARGFETLAADESVRAIVIRGAGHDFAAGADIDEFAQVRSDPVNGRRYHLEAIAPALEAIRAAPQPVIAAIEGVCVGGGLEVACACDLRLAADGARLGIPVGRLGFPLALPELRMLLELVGPSVAAELLLTGRLYEADEALAKGLVQRVVPQAEFDQALAALERSVLAGSPLAARQNKHNIRLLQERGMHYTAHDLDQSFAFLGSDDYREGVAAFLAKRPARFSGR
jgi:enoyl-CoA hydratase/carnithine racemase